MNEAPPTPKPATGDAPAQGRTAGYALPVFVIVAVGFGILLRLAPEIDLWVQGFFYRPGEGFFLRDTAFALFFYKGIKWLAPVLAVGLIAVIGLGLARPMRRLARLRRPSVVLLACLAIGSGLVVNVIFKDNWGRARPSQVVEFGGAKTFTPALVIADQCKRNCSFVAGHPSVLFSFFGLALFARRRRALAIGTVAVLGGLAGLGRMMQGAHFFSDVVFSGIFMFVTAWLLYRLVMATLDDTEPITLKAPPIVRHAATELWALIRQLTAIAMIRPIADAPPVVTARQLTTIVLAGIGVTALIIASIVWIDRPFALLLKEKAPILSTLFKPFSEFGEPTVWLGVSAIVGLALWLAMRRSENTGREAAYRLGWHQTLFVFLCTSVASIVAPLVKIFFGRPRPRLLFSDGVYGFRFFEIDPNYWSFPSGHVMTITAAAVALYLLWPRFVRYYVVLVVLVVLSRLFQTVHFPSDVIFSLYLSTIICLMIKVRFQRRGFDIFGLGPGAYRRSAATE